MDFDEFMTILGPKLVCTEGRDGFLGNTIDSIFWQVSNLISIGINKQQVIVTFTWRLVLFTNAFSRSFICLPSSVSSQSQAGNPRFNS